MNGLPVQNFPEFKQDSYTDSAGVLLHTLTIPAVLEYNKTVMQCVAFLDGATEKTPPVTLIIIPLVMSNYILSNTESACDVAIKSSASSSTGMQTTQVYTIEEGMSKLTKNLMMIWSMHSLSHRITSAVSVTVYW